jgi:bifunctional DNase/RNase
MRLVDLVGIHLEATTGTPVLLLREHDAPHRLLPIFVGGVEAAAVATTLTGHADPRPRTHDVMATLVEVLDGHVDAAEVTELRDGAFLAHLTLTGPGGERRLDTRPSDAIALALRLHAPLYVSEQVLAEAGALPPGELDDRAEEEVEQFRGFLDAVEPADFGSVGEPERDLGPEPRPAGGLVADAAEDED